MLSLISTLFLMTTLSSPFGFNENALVDEFIFRLVKAPAHNIVWSDNHNKLVSLTLVKIIDLSTGQCWLVDSESGRVIKEEAFLEEIREQEINAKAIEDNFAAAELKILKDSVSSDTSITLDPDGNIIYLGSPSPEDVADTETIKKHIVRFNVGKHAPINDLDFLDSLDFNLTDNLSVIGFASPDGLDPQMRLELAYQRMQVVKEVLINAGYNVVSSMGVVCTEDIERSKCWKTEISLEK